MLGATLAAPCSVGASVAADGLPATAIRPVSSRVLPSAPPPEAQAVAAILQRVVELYHSAAGAQDAVKQSRSEQDGLRTQLAAVTSEREVVGRQLAQLEEQLSTLQRRQQQQVDVLRKELEARVEAELQQTHQQMDQELTQAFTRQVSAFETRQRDTIEKALSQDLQMKERELEQLAREVKVQTDELLDRLSQLDTDPNVTTALQRSTTDALQKRKAELEAQRVRLGAQRDGELTKQRTEFIASLKQQQQLERQQRLTIKEASLRQSMAQLLQQSRGSAEQEWSTAQASLEGVRVRAGQIAQQQTELTKRLETFERNATAQAHRVDSLEAERQVAMAQLEETLQRSDSEHGDAALQWFGEAIQQLPPEIAGDLSHLQQRMASWAQQERALRQQRDVLRQRQLALQIAHEMEARYRQAQLKQQREVEAKARRVEELLDRATQLTGRGKFDDALQLIGEAQALSPADGQRVAMLRDDVLAAKGQQAREAQMAQLQQTFSKAMKAFEQGRYEESIALFEQVIAQESSLNQEVQVAEGDAPTP
ncbi:MAG: hypothetical protein COV75_04490 [Candidatus Omnitrophica bacterium CG11_big_fil_rev_8_21_14_0_20_63_9]|nr:MAG: hypothetical protein COV75_04490 [Candidatus Omnitrophica bacterium CG11_big_fil_rev_8_21_14_0_20_63_9]